MSEGRPLTKEERIDLVEKMRRNPAFVEANPELLKLLAAERYWRERCEKRARAMLPKGKAAKRK